jgi:hypothetical protein
MAPRRMPLRPREAQVADRYDSMTTAELQAEADNRTPAVDLSGATTNAQRAELLRDADAATPTTTTASSGGGDGTGSGGDKDHGELTHGHAGYSSQDDLDTRLAAARGEASPRMATSGWRRPRLLADRGRWRDRRAGAEVRLPGGGRRG